LEPLHHPPLLLLHPQFHDFHQPSSLLEDQGDLQMPLAQQVCQDPQTQQKIQQKIKHVSQEQQISQVQIQPEPQEEQHLQRSVVSPDDGPPDVNSPYSPPYP